MSLIALFGGYVTSFLGFSLGKSTLEEHNEIKIKALFFSYIFQFLAILGLFFIHSTFSIIVGIIFLFILLIGYFKNHYILEFNALFIYIISFHLYFNSQYFFICIFPIISLIIENSFKKFNRHEEIYKIIILVILGILII